MHNKITTNTNLIVFNREKYMKTMLELIPIYTSHGLDTFDLNFCEMMNPISALNDDVESEDYINTLNEYKSRYGLKYFQCHLPYPMRGEDSRKIEKQKRALSYCEKLGIPVAVIHPIIGSIEDNVRYFESLKPYIPENVTLAIENMETKEEISTSKELLEILDNLSYKAGICLDTGHLNIMGGDAPAFIKDTGEKLIATHINDNDGNKDQHLLPGFGTIKWEEVIPAFKRYYNGYLNYEAMFFSRGCSEMLEGHIVELAKAIGNWLLDL